MEISNTTAMREVFCRYIRKNGRIIYPKNSRFFHFWVPVKSEMDTNYEQLSMFDTDEL